MIRNKFHNFLKTQLVGIITANKSLKQWMGKCKEYEKQNKQQQGHKNKKKDKDLDYDVMEE